MKSNLLAREPDWLKKQKKPGIDKDPTPAQQVPGLKSDHDLTGEGSQEDLIANNFDATKQSPDQMIANERTAAELDLPAETALTAPDQLKEKQRSADIRKKVRTHPSHITKGFYSDPQKAQAYGEDDFEPLAYLEAVVDRTLEVGSFHAGKWDAAKDRMKLQDIAWRDMQGEQLTVDEQQWLDARKDHYDPRIDIEAGQEAAFQITGGVVEQLPSMLHAAYTSLDTALFGGVTATGIVAVTPPGALLAPVSLPTAFITGAGVGMKVGMADYFYKELAGEAFQDLKTIQTVGGDVIDPAAARAGAYVSAGLGIIPEVARWEMLFKYAPGFKHLKDKIMLKAGGDPVKYALQNDDIRIAFMKNVAGLGLAVGSEVVTEYMQELFKSIVGHHVAGAVEEDEILPPNIQEAFEGAWTQGKGAIYPTIGIHSLPFLIGMKSDQLRHQRARQRQNFVEDLHAGVADVKTKDRYEEGFDRFLQAIQDENPDGMDQVSMEAEKLSELVEAAGLKQADIQKSMPDLYDAWMGEIDRNGDVIIQLKDMVKLAGVAPSSDSLLDMKFKDDAYSIRENIDHYQKREKEVQAETDKQFKEEGLYDDPVRQALRTEYMDTFNYSEQMADMYAAIGAAQNNVLAAEVGMEPLPFFLSQNLSFRKETLEPARERQPYNRMVGLVDRYLKGKLPTQEEAMGRTLIEHLMERGGLRDEGGELAALDLDKPLEGRKKMVTLAERKPTAEDLQAQVKQMEADGIPAPKEKVQRRKAVLAREEGMTFETAVELLREEGYVAQDVLPDVNMLLDLLSQEAGGDYVYPTFSPNFLNVERQRLLAMVEEGDVLMERIDRLGLDVNKLSAREIADAIENAEILEQPARSMNELSADEQKVVNRQIDKQDNPKRTREALEELAGTTWAKKAIEAALIRDAMENILEGKKPESGSLLDSENKQVKALRTQLEVGGWDAVWDRFEAYSVLSSPTKPEWAVPGSFLSCEPSRDCAKACYALTGHQWPMIASKAELVEIAIQKDPVRVAKMIADEYQDTVSGMTGAALRLFDRGNGNSFWLPMIEALQDLGVRTHIFSKHPEFLDQIDDFHLKLLSLDETNQELIKESDHKIAYVYRGSQADKDFLTKHVDRIGVVLPIREGIGYIEQDLINQIPEDIRRTVCPIDSGLRAIGVEWFVMLRDGSEKLFKGTRETGAHTAAENYANKHGLIAKPKAGYVVRDSKGAIVNSYTSNNLEAAKKKAGKVKGDVVPMKSWNCINCDVERGLGCYTDATSNKDIIATSAVTNTEIMQTVELELAELEQKTGALDENTRQIILNQLAARLRERQGSTVGRAEASRLPEVATTTDQAAIGSPAIAEDVASGTEKLERYDQVFDYDDKTKDKRAERLTQPSEGFASPAWHEEQAKELKSRRETKVRREALHVENLLEKDGRVTLFHRSTTEFDQFDDSKLKGTKVNALGHYLSFDDDYKVLEPTHPILMGFSVSGSYLKIDVDEFNEIASLAVKNDDLIELLKESYAADGIDFLLIEGENHVVVFNQDAVTKIKDPDIYKEWLLQEAARGYITMNEARTMFETTLTDKANASTLIHEGAHFYDLLQQRYAAQGYAGAAGRVQVMNNWHIEQLGDVIAEARKLNLFNVKQVSKKRWTIHDSQGNLVDEVEGNKTAANKAAKALNEKSISDFQSMTPDAAIAFINSNQRSSNNNERRIEVAKAERFARGFEAYVREGKAPSTALKTVFRNFRAMLINVYRAIKNLNIKITDDVRQAFDEMLATPAEIEAARQEVGFAPMFTDAEEMGANPKQWKEYMDLHTEAVDEAEQKRLDELMRDMRTERPKRLKSLRDSIERNVRDRLQKERVFQLRKFLTDGKFFDGTTQLGSTDLEGVNNKISRGSIERVFDAVPVELNFVSATDGTDADMWSTTFGYANNEAMLNDLITAPPLEELIKRQTQAEYNQRRGEVFDEIDIVNEAMDAIHNNKTAEAIHLDLRAIETRLQWKKSPRKQAKDNALARINMLTLAQLTPGKFWQLESKHARLARMAFLDNDFPNAHEHKRLQLENHYMARYASEIKTSFASKHRQLMSLTKKEKQGRMGKAHQHFRDSVNQILESMALIEPPGVIVKPRISLGAFVDWTVNNSIPIEITPGVVNHPEMIAWNQTVMPLLNEKVNAALSIAGAAEQQLEYIYEGETQSLDASVNEVTNSITEFQEKKNTKLRQNLRQHKTKIEQMAHTLDWAVTGMRKIEFITQDFDGGEIQGISSRYIFEPLAKAQRANLDLQKEVLTPIMVAFKKRNAASNAKMHEEISFMGIFMEYQDLIAIALNVGNQGNLTKLAEGYQEAGRTNWTEERIMAVLQDKLSDADWTLVQEIWDAIEVLYEPLYNIQTKATGVPPGKVAARDFVTKSGMAMRGGYYPVKYDRDRRSKSREDEQRNEVKSLFENNFMVPKASTGVVEKRSNYSAPIDLTLDVMLNHINEVSHFVTHYEAVTNVNKLISHKQFKSAVADYYGINVSDSFRPWLQAIANDTGTEPALNVIDGISKLLRNRTTVMAMGWKISTALTQLLGLTTIGDTLGAKYLSRGLKEVFNNPKKAYASANEMSGELRYLLQTADRDIKSAYQAGMLSPAAMKGKVPIPDSVAKYAFVMLMSVQKIVSVINWHGAYIKAVDEGKLGEDAIQYADSALRTTQSAGGVKDLSAVQRGTHTAKLFTMFMSFFNALFNRMYAANKKAKRRMTKKQYARAVGELIESYSWLVVLPVILDLTARGDFEDLEDDETYAGTIIKESVMYMGASLPMAGQVMSGALSEYGYSITPAAGFGDAVATLGDFFDEDKELNETAARAATKVFGGYYLGLPTGQIINTAEYIYKFDEVENEIQEFLFGVKRE